MSGSAQATFCAALVDQWARDGVRHAMVAPGSRSTPMALALAENPDVAVHVFHDERSAGFAALGAALVSDVPSIVLCTSGTAATHLHAAVVEASLSAVPMLVVTADRPPELRDIHAPQTIDQTHLYGRAVRWFVDPGVADASMARTWRGLARQALDAATGLHPGPVHLNLPFRDPLVATPGDLPEPLLGPLVRPEPALRIGSLAMTVDRARGIVVAGRGVDDPGAVHALADAAGWPVLADPRSGCRGFAESVVSFDSLLRHDDLADLLLPEVVVHLGEPPASKVLGQWLTRAGGVQVAVSADPSTTDPVRTVTHRVVASPGAFCRRLTGEVGRERDPQWVDRWQQVEKVAQEAIAATLVETHIVTEIDAARAVGAFDGPVVVASSMPIRDVEWYGTAAQRATVYANRGANGIDGTIATATGVALASGQPVAVLLGDIALVHDSSSLAALSRRGVDLRIVVVDNDGGGIFSFLPQATEVPADRFEQLFGTPHGTDVVALATAHGLAARTVPTAHDLALELAEPGPRVMRVASDRAENVELHRKVNAAVAAALDQLLG